MCLINNCLDDFSKPLPFFFRMEAVHAKSLAVQMGWRCVEENVFLSGFGFFFVR